MAHCVNALKEWTGKANATTVFDSTVDEFTDECLFAKIKGKRNVVVIGFTTDGDVFGGFYSVAVTKQGDGFFDPDLFAFSFESHGRCMTPQRFVLRQFVKNEAHVEFNKGENGFVWFYVSEGGFTLGGERSDSYCNTMSRVFEELEDTTLTGKNGTWQGPYHHCTRLVTVQLE